MVRDCTPTRSPHALFGFTVAPARWAHWVPAWKYVTKSTDASRSLVSVNDDSPTSKALPCTDGNDALEGRLPILDLEPECPCDRVHQVDVEAGVVAVGVLELGRRIRLVDSDHQLSRRPDRRGHGGGDGGAGR